MANISVTYTATDGFTKTKACKTLTVAQSFAYLMLGAEQADILGNKAKAYDGTGYITVKGATLAELFPAETVAPDAPVAVAPVAKPAKAKASKPAKVAPETVPAMPADLFKDSAIAAADLGSVFETIAPATDAPVAKPAKPAKPGAVKVIRVMIQAAHYHYVYTGLDGVAHIYESKRYGKVNGAMLWQWTDLDSGQTGLTTAIESEMFVRRELIALGEAERVQWHAANSSAPAAKVA